MKRRPFLVRLFRQIAWYIHGLFRHEIVIDSKQGVFSVSTRDHGLSAWLYRNGHYEFETSLEAVRFLKSKGYIPESGGLMLDVGANIGVICIGLLREKEFEHAIAIEPELQNFGLLQKNVRQNGLDTQILCLPFAVSASDQMLTMQVSRRNKGDHRIQNTNSRKISTESVLCTVQVQSHPIGVLLRRPEVIGFTSAKPALLWIDVQGYEGFVFEGAEELLSMGVPTVSELWPEGMHSAGIEIQRFADIVQKYWTAFWIRSDETFLRYPIEEMGSILEQLQRDKKFTNAIFVNEVSSEVRHSR
jgi:FkbM family methyltransferase